MVIIKLQRWIQSCRPGVQELSGGRISRQAARLLVRPNPSNQPATLLKASLFTLGLVPSSGSEFLGQQSTQTNLSVIVVKFVSVKSQLFIETAKIVFLCSVQLLSWCPHFILIVVM